MMGKTFAEIREQRRRRTPGVCPICEKKMKSDEIRGRIMLTLGALRYYSVEEQRERADHRSGGKGGGPKHDQSNVATETRVICENCSVELYEKMRALLPPRMQFREG